MRLFWKRSFKYGKNRIIWNSEKHSCNRYSECVYNQLKLEHNRSTRGFIESNRDLTKIAGEPSDGYSN